MSQSFPVPCQQQLIPSLMLCAVGCKQNPVLSWDGWRGNEKSLRDAMPMAKLLCILLPSAALCQAGREAISVLKVMVK